MIELRIRHVRLIHQKGFLRTFHRMSQQLMYNFKFISSFRINHALDLPLISSGTYAGFIIYNFLLYDFMKKKKHPLNKIMIKI